MTQELLSTGEVAAIFSVDPATVTRWADKGLLSSIRTPGGHRRFKRSDVHGFLFPDETVEVSS